MNRLQIQLITRLDRDKAHVLPLDCFGDRLRVDRLISRRTAVISQLWAFLLERGMVFAQKPAKLKQKRDLTNGCTNASHPLRSGRTHRYVGPQVNPVNHAVATATLRL
jgi:hypothetical protein